MTLRNHDHFHWFWAWPFKCLTLVFRMLWSWKLHPSTIIILNQLGFLIKSALCEKLLWAPSYLPRCLTPEFLVSLASVSTCLRVKAVLRSLLSVSPDTWILLFFSRKIKIKIQWSSSSAYIHFKCFNMFITFKVLVYKKHSKLRKTLMISQNSGFTVIKPMSSHHPPMFNCYSTTQVTCGC